MGDVKRIRGGWFVFGEGADQWKAPDPTDEARQAASWKCRYDMAALTQTECFQLAEAFEVYHYLATENTIAGAVEKLKAIRRAVRDQP